MISCYLNPFVFAGFFVCSREPLKAEPLNQIQALHTLKYIHQDEFQNLNPLFSHKPNLTESRSFHKNDLKGTVYAFFSDLLPKAPIL